MMANKLFRQYSRSGRTLVVASAATPLLVAILLSGCVAEKGIIPQPLYSVEKAAPTAESVIKDAAKGSAGSLAVSANPLPPAPTKLSSVKQSPQQANTAEAADISLMFDQIPLPSFIQVSFGTILKKNFSVDPQVSARTDLVTLRTGKPQTPTQTLETLRILLKSYGVAVTEMGGFYRIAPDNNQSAYSPEIRRGRAQPEVPLPLRPIFNLIELSAVKNGDVFALLAPMFGQKLTIYMDNTRNALMISGQSGDVSAALDAIQVLDQPAMRGRTSKSITPSSLSADELGRKLVEVLTAEGYSASTAVAAGAAITLIPIPASNSLLTFTVDPAISDHIVKWAKKLDTLDNRGRRSGGYFTYPVKYADAQDLAKTMQELMAATPVPAVATTPAAPAAARTSGKIVVNAATNSLIFLSSQDEYTQLLGILKELDQPAKSALIEVTVAEVRVTDKNQLGIDWSLNSVTRGNGTLVGGTAGGVGVGTGGLTLNFLNSASQIKATLNALASSNRASILSTPRVMARNGETATIQVGQEVPIITSQQSNANTAVAGSTGILQTVQYRNTGVILKVKPVIHAGNRIELDVSQEVSAAGETTTGVNTSPTISSRKIETKLSIRDGATVLLGGLMSSNNNKGDAGIPLLKDIPAFGQLFRANTDSTDKTELIILITPYVINDDLVAEQVTQAFRNQLGPWAQTSGPLPNPKISLPTLEVGDAPRSDKSSDAAPKPEELDSVTPSLPVDSTPESAPVSPYDPASTVAPATGSPPTDSVNTQAQPATAPPAQSGFAPASGNQDIDPAILEELRRAAAAAGINVPPKVDTKKTK